MSSTSSREAPTIWWNKTWIVSMAQLVTMTLEASLGGKRCCQVTFAKRPISCFFITLFSSCISFAAASCEDSNLLSHPEMFRHKMEQETTKKGYVSIHTDAFRYVNTLSDWFILDVSFFVVEGTTSSCDAMGDWSSCFVVLILEGLKLKIVSGFMEGCTPAKGTVGYGMNHNNVCHN